VTRGEKRRVDANDGVGGSGRAKRKWEEGMKGPKEARARWGKNGGKCERGERVVWTNGWELGVET